MKNFLNCFALSILSMAAATGFAQTTIQGHVFAEVVESVSASTYSHSSFTIKRNQTAGIDFGQIEIKSAAAASCSLIIGMAHLRSNTNQLVAIETSAFSNQSMLGNAINGYQSINLQFQPDANMLDQNALSYQGNVNIVLAYN